MLPLIFQFISSACIIALAGFALARTTDRFADLTGLGRLFVGGLFLAGATSMPELMVDINAIMIGKPDLAIGDLLGSSLINLSIFCLIVLLYPLKNFSIFTSGNQFSAVFALIMTTLVGLVISTKLNLQIFGISIFLWFVLIIYLIGMIWLFKNQAPSPKVKRNPLSFFKVSMIAIEYFVSIIVIIFIAPLFVSAADQLAELSGLGHSFIGTTLVAFTTSLPELVTTLAAFQLRQPQLAIGNIFGSNAFNMILFLPLDFLYNQSLFISAASTHLITVFAIILSTAWILMPKPYPKYKERNHYLLVLTTVLLSMGLIYYLSH